MVFLGIERTDSVNITVRLDSERLTEGQKFVNVKQIYNSCSA